ncbi:MAG: undecaprenyl-phosphate glucose phosphotransferase [Betaproteobacteria bacterium]|nr:MAG: undecaprenyl-phosphate glucose phosphotransferase [Betaproteobacteria bacterium]
MFHRLLDAVIVLSALVFAATAYDGAMKDAYWLAGLLAVLGLQVAGEITQIYASWRVYTLRQEVSELALACLVVGALLVTGAFVSKTSDQYSRVVMVLWWTLAFSGLAVERFVIRVLLRASRARGRNTRSLAIAGAGELAQRVAERVLSTGSLGLRPIGYFDDDVPVGTNLPHGPDLAVQGDLEALVRLAREGGVDYVYIALPLAGEEQVKALIHDLSDTTASVFFVPDFFVFEMLQARWTEIDGMPLVRVFDTPFLGVDGALKRMEDLLIAAAALTVTAPLMLAIALGVKLSSPGPVLFRQRRYGLSGKVVEVWKFRSMGVQEDGDEIPQARRGDPRVTRFGAFLRRTSLDELPQFFNVLQGHMSVVGPRPHAVAHNEQYRKLVPGYMLRHKVKPGITGWAQVNGWRGETDTVEKMQMRVEHDMHYIRNWSLALDMKIVALTVVRGFSGPGAY